MSPEKKRNDPTPFTADAAGRRVPAALVLTLFFLSGGTGLVYELIWTRQLAFVFGGTTYAITTVLVSFMAGLGMGSYLAGRACDRIRRPGHIYGLFEIGIGVYALFVPVLLHLAEPLYRVLYPHVWDAPWLLTAVRFFLSCLVLIVPTTCMGATLPLLVHQLAADRGSFGRSVGLLYGVNTLGAVFGTVAAGFWLIPTWGLSLTTRLAAAGNVLIGLIALMVFRAARIEPRLATAKVAVDAQEVDHDSRQVRQAMAVVFAVSGFASMVYQIAWTRVLVMSLGSTTYSFTCVLAAFILGLALGSLILSRWVDRWRDLTGVIGSLQLAIGLSAALIVPLYGRLPMWVQRIVAGHHQNYDTVVGLEFLLVIAVTLVPTLLMGGMFPLVTRAIAGTHEQAARATGRAYAANTVGTILGAFLAGFVLIRGDVLGVRNSIVAAAVMNGVVGAWVMLRVDPKRSLAGARAAVPVGVAMLIPIIGVLAGTWNRELLTSAPFLRYDQPPGAEPPPHEVVYFGDGVELTVAVAVWPGREEFLSLSVNGKADASTDIADMTTMLLIGHIPALAVDRGERACVIGLGSGMSLGALACYPSFTRMECAELSDEVIKAARYFGPYARDVLNHPCVTMVRADGRNHLLLTEQRYDVIISQPSNPWIAGVANLFSREFLHLCHDRLSDDGVLGLWVHSYRMSVGDFQTVVRTLYEAFDTVSVWEMSSERDYLLLASKRSGPVSLASVQRRFAIPAVREDLYRIGLGRIEQVLGRFIASGNELRDWASGSPINTDDNALLEFSAPRNMYRGQELVLAQALNDLRRSPFDEWMAYDESVAEQQRIVQLTNDAVRSRLVRTDGLMRWMAGDTLGCVEPLMRAYSLDPGSCDVYRLLHEWRGRMPIEVPALARRPDVRAMLDRIDALAPPVLADKTGSSLDEIGAKMMRHAGVARDRDHLDAAIQHLIDARRMSPDNPVYFRSLADVLLLARREADAVVLLDAWIESHPRDGVTCLLRARLAVDQGDAEQAVSRLLVAMEAGAIGREEVREDPAFEALLIDPRLREALGGR